MTYKSMSLQRQVRGLPRVPVMSVGTQYMPREHTGQLAGVVDTQYAGSRLGDYSASWINGAIQTVLNEQQARVGRFLTYKQKLVDLYNRAANIKGVDNTRGSLLVSRAISGQTNQTAIEAGAIRLISEAGTIKANPIVKILTNEDVNQKDFSADLIARGADIISSLKNMITQSAAINVAMTKHEKVVKTLESDIVSIESELAGTGFFQKAGKGITSVLSTPVTMLKYGAIIAGVGAAFYFLGPALAKKRK